TVFPSGEAKDPAKDTAWALIVTLAISAMIYMTVQTVAVGTVPGLASSEKPLVDSAQIFLGPLAGSLISALACVSIIGNLSGNALASPRVTYAFAEHRDVPALFGKVHPRYGTPVISIMFFCGIGGILAISGTFVWLAMMSVVARLATYLVTCLAVP